MRHKGLITLAVAATASFSIFSPASPLPATSRESAQAALQAAWTWTIAAGQQVEATAADALGITTNSAAEQTATTAASASTKAAATPIEPAVKNIKLTRAYTYSFEAGTPASVRTAFKKAVAVYNQTGVVDLRPGAATTFANHITLGTYAKPTSDQQSTVELGEGGPSVIYSTLTRTGVNHAKAEFNTAYQGSVKESVALHELGHALGLGHSKALTSVMYPMDQGRLTLSPADLATLKTIYPK